MLARQPLRLVPSSLHGQDRVADAELVARARAGDAWAEGVIYQRYARELGDLAARLLRSRTDALDVVQEVFIGALDDLGSLREPSALRAWLRQRTVRRVHRVFRRRRLQRLFGLGRDDEADGFVDVVHPGASPEVLAELSRVSERLRGLPDRQRMAWVLHCVEGETLSSVAEACGVSLATAKRDIAAVQAQLQAEETR